MDVKLLQAIAATPAHPETPVFRDSLLGPFSGMSRRPSIGLPIRKSTFSTPRSLFATARVWPEFLILQPEVLSPEADRRKSQKAASGEGRSSDTYLLNNGMSASVDRTHIHPSPSALSAAAYNQQASMSSREDSEGFEIRDGILQFIPVSRPFSFPPSARSAPSLGLPIRKSSSFTPQTIFLPRPAMRTAV